MKLEKLKKQIPQNEYNKGAIDMLEFIARQKELEESKMCFFKSFYSDILFDAYKDKN